MRFSSPLAAKVSRPAEHCRQILAVISGLLCPTVIHFTSKGTRAIVSEDTSGELVDQAGSGSECHGLGGTAQAHIHNQPVV